MVKGRRRRKIIKRRKGEKGGGGMGKVMEKGGWEKGRERRESEK